MTDTVDDASLYAGYPRTAAGYDELFDATGAVRPHWRELAGGLAARGAHALPGYRDRVRRLVDDHGITYNPVAPHAPHDGAARWNLDGIPLVLAADDWAHLERGLVQRARLFDALLADLYGAQRTLREGLVPPRLVFAHTGYVRAAHGVTLPAPHQLFLHGVDVTRGADGRFRVIRDRTQAPSGIGYAMVDRRVLSRAMPTLYQTVNPRPLSPFAQAMRLALRDVAPAGAEDPVVVVLSPGTASETAFDQAYIAATLGYPLVESADLVVQNGALWMRSLGSLTRVDVVLRRVDAAYADPLDLRPDSHLGVVGLVEVIRRGAVSVVNTLGSGVLENPALLPLLPALSRALLGEDLLLESVPAHWGGTREGLAALTARFPDLVLRSAVTTEAVVVSTLTAAAQQDLLARVRTEPERWVGCERAQRSFAPTLTDHDTDHAAGLVGAAVRMRLFTVGMRAGFRTMAGGLVEVTAPDRVAREAQVSKEPQISKDLWVCPLEADATAEPAAPEQLPAFAVPAVDVVTSPRVLGDLFWLGRYAERAEDTARLLIAVRERYQDYRFRPDLAGSDSLPVLLTALTTLSPGDPAPDVTDPVPAAEFRSLTIDPERMGSLAQSFAGLDHAARAVRDQLSNDTWAVLADVQRALAALAADPDDDGALLGATQTRVLSGMLALSGLAAESMVRDVGWHMMDVGRRIERAGALTSLLAATLTTVHAPATERALVDSVLVAAESAVTFRRRHHQMRLAAVAQLLLFDTTNPRSLAYLLERIRDDLRALPDSSALSRPERLAADLHTRLRRVDPADLEAVTAGVRTELADLLAEMHRGLAELSDVLLQGPLSLPGDTRPLWGGGERRDLP